jgi:hypothetical protein
MLVRGHVRPTREVKYLTKAFVIFLLRSTIMQVECIQKIIYCELKLIYLTNLTIFRNIEMC